MLQFMGWQRVRHDDATKQNSLIKSLLGKIANYR